MATWICWHPMREELEVYDDEIKEKRIVYCDKPSHNQDPYIWNDPFLHTYCHMNSMKSVSKGDTIIWVTSRQFQYENESIDTLKVMREQKGKRIFYNATNSLLCDLVFVVAEIEFWENPNNAAYNSEKFVSKHTPEAINDHYKWAIIDHEWKKRKNGKKTLWADSENSFQITDSNNHMLDILDGIKECNLELDEKEIISGLTHSARDYDNNGRGRTQCKAFKTELSVDQTKQLTSWLINKGAASNLLKSDKLYKIRKDECNGKTLKSEDIYGSGHDFIR